MGSRLKAIVAILVTTGLLVIGIASQAGPAAAAVSCTMHRANTAGWIKCTGSGTVRIVIDCKRPQISDYKGPWTYYNGSITLSGECRFGINSVQYQVR
jgi:hypothetical protein